ncbi:hypothetical protein D3C81_2335990 [compost metagenome]
MIDVQHQHGYKRVPLLAQGVLRQGTVKKGTAIVQTGQFVRARGHDGKPVCAFHFVLQAPGGHQR